MLRCSRFIYTSLKIGSVSHWPVLQAEPTDNYWAHWVLDYTKLCWVFCSTYEQGCSPVMWKLYRLVLLYYADYRVVQHQLFNTGILNWYIPGEKVPITHLLTQTSQHAVFNDVRGLVQDVTLVRLGNQLGRHSCEFCEHDWIWDRNAPKRKIATLDRGDSLDFPHCLLSSFLSSSKTNRKKCWLLILQTCLCVFTDNQKWEIIIGYLWRIFPTSGNVLD